MSEATFQPQIDAVSSAIDQRIQETQDTGRKTRWEALYKLNEKQQMELALRRAKQEEERQREEQFSFHPQLCKHDRSASPNRPYKIEERAMLWHKQREAKRKALRARDEEELLEACPFQPTLLLSPDRAELPKPEGSMLLTS